MPVLKQIGAVVDRRKSVQKRRRRWWKRRKRRMWKGGGDDTYQEEKKGGGNTKKRRWQRRERDIAVNYCYFENGIQVFRLAGGEKEIATGGRGEDGRRQWSWLAKDTVAATVFWRRKRGQRSRRRLRQLQRQRKQGVAAREDGSNWKRLDSSRGKRGIEVADGGRGGRGRGQRRRAAAAAGKEDYSSGSSGWKSRRKQRRLEERAAAMADSW
ncbi:hypothetical protein BHE74_00021318 [Ensete ventricosum]|nr:hypothetical protein BHE74_00021318 [Ensete ventricosum]